MNHLTTGIALAWIMSSALLFIYGLQLIRLILNHQIGPMKSDLPWNWRPRWKVFSMGLSAADVDDAGKLYLRRAVHLDWVWWAFLAIGFGVVILSDQLSY